MWAENYSPFYAREFPISFFSRKAVTHGGRGGHVASPPPPAVPCVFFKALIGSGHFSKTWLFYWKSLLQGKSCGDAIISDPIKHFV